MQEPGVAAIIVSYRSAALTIAALRSLEAERRNTRLPIRALVIDNASGDLPTISEAAARNRWSSWVSLIAAPRNGGFAYGNNLGIAYAFAQAPPAYLYLLNPDTEVRPGAIAALVSFLESHPSAGIAGSSFEHADGSAWKIAFRFPGLLSELSDGLHFRVATRLLWRWRVPMEMGDTPQCVDWVSGASMMIRPSVLAVIGGFDERYFLYFEETDFCRRAARAGFRTWYVPQSRVMHLRGQSTQVTDLNRGRGRLPAYWFESRRRYFALSFGRARATLIDAVALLAYGVGWLKGMMLLRTHSLTPHFVRDLWRHSLLRPRNRAIAPAAHGDLGMLPNVRPANQNYSPDLSASASVACRD
jgi:GT2 family glycosyltransferase